MFSGQMISYRVGGALSTARAMPLATGMKYVSNGLAPSSANRNVQISSCVSRARRSRGAAEEWGHEHDKYMTAMTMTLHAFMGRCPGVCCTVCAERRLHALAGC